VPHLSQLAAETTDRASDPLRWPHGITCRFRGDELHKGRFDGRIRIFQKVAASTWKPNTIDRPINQVSVQFASTPAYGAHAHACDHRQLPVPTVTNPLGLQRHVPAALLLVQPTKKQVHLVMSQLVRMTVSNLAMGALATMERSQRHSEDPSCRRGSSLGSMPQY
jgi:hypothetical protein